MRHRNRDKTILEKTRKILRDRGYRKTCYPLEDMAQAIDETKRNVKRKVGIYKWTGLALLTLIPILSALMSALLSMETKAPTLMSLTRTLSFSLTLLTILNSIFKPGERFRSICSLGIQVDDFGSLALESLTRIPQDKLDELFLLALVDKRRKRLDSYRKQLIDLFLPEASQLPDRREKEYGGAGRLEEPEVARAGVSTAPPASPGAADRPHASQA